MAHRGESSNGSHYSRGTKTRGFGRLRPAAGKSLMDQLREQGYTESTSEPVKPEPKTPPQKPADAFTDEELAEMKRRRRLERFKIFRGSEALKD